jgi:hypothetical protein
MARYIVTSENREEFMAKKLGMKKEKKEEDKKDNDLHHFYYNRNTESSKKFKINQDFGQNIEPAGEYMNIDAKTPLKAPDERWEMGKISFKNPLFIDHKDTSSQGWKKDLSERFGGLTGKKLSAAVKKAGHDAIITKTKNGFSETINLGGIKTPQKKAN